MPCVVINNKIISLLLHTETDNHTMNGCFSLGFIAPFECSVCKMDVYSLIKEGLGQFTRNYTQTVKRAADNKRRYAPGEGSIPPVLLSGVSKGVPPLAHDFACKV